MKNERAVYILTYLIEALGEESDESLPESDYLGSYEINDAVYGTEVKVELTSSKRVFESNGLPNHKTGDFPNSGNPNSIEEQDYHYEMPLELTIA